MILKGKALIAQGGGPTVVINQSLVGAVLELRKYSQVTKIYGALRGVSGIVEEDFVDLSQETQYNLERVATTPSSALFSTRDKPDKQYCIEILKVFKLHDIRYFFYIGGNDSSDTLRIVSEYAKEIGYELRAVHIPKTIDNDLMCNDHTPGYGSAARFVAQAFTGANLDIRSLPGVYMGVVMGRHAGFLTAAASIAKKYPDDGPHLIYMPERPFSLQRFVEDVKKTYIAHGRCIAAVSEGIQDEKGNPIITKLMKHTEKDAHGNIRLSGTGALGDLLTQSLQGKIPTGRIRSDTLGYLQRSFVGCVSDVDQQEAREVGEKAVQFAIWHGNGSVTIQRTGEYSVDYELMPLHVLAGKTKTMPDAFINEEGNNVTEQFKSYVRPLLGTNLCDVHLLRAPKVPKIIHMDGEIEAAASDK